MSNQEWTPEEKDIHLRMVKALVDCMSSYLEDLEDDRPLGIELSAIVVSAAIVASVTLHGANDLCSSHEELSSYVARVFRRELLKHLQEENSENGEDQTVQ